MTLVFVFTGVISAQIKTITGAIKSANDGSSIPGASVQVKGTGTGSISDVDGNYSIQVSGNNVVLIFKFIGMKTIEIPVEDKEVINVLMEVASADIDEVLVIGYGTTTKQTFTGTATKVDSKNIEAKNVSNITQALQGEVAGVQVINSNGQPGSKASLRIRGIGSINGSSDPLYIVDGIPVQGDLNSISPSDIESSTILKDASATAIYGSRGANGVVIITTKQGKKGKSEIAIDVKSGTNLRLLPEYNVFTNPEEYVETAYSALYTQGRLLGERDPGKYANTYLFNSNSRSPGFDSYYNLWSKPGAELIDPQSMTFWPGSSRRYNPEKWSDELFQASSRNEAGVRISGGTDKNSFYTSFNYLNDKGYYLNSDYQRFTGRSNIKHEIRPWLEGTLNMSFMHATSNFAGGQDTDSNNGFWFAANMPPIYPVYARNADGTLVNDEKLGGYQFDYGDGRFGRRRFGALTNAVATSTLDVVRRYRNQFGGNSRLVAKIYSGLTYESTFGLEYLTSDFDNLGNAFYGGSAEQGGSIFKNKDNYLAFTATNLLRYKTSVGSHTFNGFIAHEGTALEYKTLSTFKTNLADPFSLELNNAVINNPAGSYKIDYALSSYFGQIAYDFDEKYFVQAVLRRDGSSRFKENKWGTFGSISAAWVLTSEAFMESFTDKLNNLKVKASYGVNGEQRGLSAYTGYSFYQVSNLNDLVALSPQSIGNPNLTWERASMYQVGAELEAFNRINLDIDYYVKNTNNLIFQKRIAPSLGYAIIDVNDGTMVNSGVEISFKSTVFENDAWLIDVGVNGAFERNKIKSMPIETSTGKQKVINVNGIYAFSVGRSIYDIYTVEYAGVNTDNGASMWYRYYDEKANGSINYITDMETYLHENKDRVGTIKKETTTNYWDATNKYVDKSPIPTVRGAFNLSATYNNIELTALFAYSLGGHAYDGNYATLMGDDLVGSNNWHKDIQYAWKKPGDITGVPAITSGYTSGDINYNHANRTSTRFITSTDYLALNNIVLAYTFNKNLLDKVKLKGLKVYASADNLWVGTKRKGFYPNTSETGASSVYQYVPMTSISGGLNIKF